MLKVFVLVVLVIIYCETGSAQESVCSQPIVTGRCRAFFERYGYDQKTGSCKQFIYGGCEGNDNNFMSLQECQQACTRMRRGYH